MSGLALAFAMSVAASPIAVLGADKQNLAAYSRFEEAKVWAEYELGCRHGLKADKQRFKSRYGRRIERIETWFRGRYDVESLRAVLPTDFVMVGGCRRSQSGERLMPSEEAFSAQLRALEKIVRRGGN